MIAAGSPVGRVVADEVEGGLRVRGEWAFASGCLHSKWFDARAILHRGGQPVSAGGGLASLMTCLVPATAVEIIESWDVAGMRGTGSHGYRVRDAFVPAGRSVPLFGEAPDRATSPEYAIPTVSFAHIAFASIGLGGAEAVIEEFTALARDKTPRMSRALRETAVAQAALARARARVQAAIAHRDWAVAQAWDEACAGDLSIAARADIRLAAVSGVETAVDVIDSLYHVAGTSGIFTGSGLQRRFQDIHVLSQQVFARPSHYENVGKILLDLDYDAALL